MTEKLSREQLHEQWSEHHQKAEELMDAKNSLDPKKLSPKQYGKLSGQLHEQWHEHWTRANSLLYTKLAVELFEDWNDGNTVSKLESLISSSAMSFSWLPEFVSVAKDFHQSGEVLTATKRIEDNVGTEGFRPIYSDYLSALRTQCSFRSSDPNDERYSKPRLVLKLDNHSQPQLYKGETGKLIPLTHFGARVEDSFKKFVSEEYLPPRLISPMKGKILDKLCPQGPLIITDVIRYKIMELLLSPTNRRIKRVMSSYDKAIPDDTYITLVKALHFSLPVTSFDRCYFKAEPNKKGFGLYNTVNQK